MQQDVGFVATRVDRAVYEEIVRQAKANDRITTREVAHRLRRSVMQDRAEQPAA